MIFKKQLLLIVVLGWCVALQAQTPVQQVDITADELLGGSVDQQLQALGKRAVAENLTVSVTAPSYWRALVEEQIRTGAENPELPITFRETMVESVIVRLVGAGSGNNNQQSRKADSGPVGPAPELPQIETTELDNAADSLRAQARAAINSQSAPGMAAPAPKISATFSPIKAPQMVMGETAFETPESDRADSVQESAPAVQNAAEQVMVAATDTSPVDVAEAVVSTPTENADEARIDLERRLNKGREIRKELEVFQLRRGDQLFVSGDLVAVVRRSSTGSSAYWLKGELDLEQSAIEHIQGRKYAVRRRVEGVASGVDEAEPESVTLAALNLDQVPDERVRMEARYNQGKSLAAVVSPDGLRSDDMLYVGETLIMVVRRGRASMKRFWLQGELDLQRPELEQLGQRKYRVKRTPH